MKFGTKRGVALAVSAALVGSGALTMGTAAQAAPPQDPAVTFHTSFEEEQPQAVLRPVEDSTVNFTGMAFRQDSLLPLVQEVTSTDGGNPPGEAPAMAADGNASSKWLEWAPTGWLHYTMAEPVSITGYTLTAGNDAPERDPKAFTVEGSNDGTTWVTLDTQRGQSFPKRLATKSYTLSQRSEAFSHYRLNVTQNNGATIMQLGDFELLDAERTVEAQPMKVEIAGGPATSWTAKPKVGWTGLKSLRYSGRTVNDGDAAASSQLFENLNIPVTKGMQLSYKIFPELDAAVSYAATHVAIDLVMSDGSRLSTSAATDEYGFGASAAAQGQGKILWPDQWNSVRIDLSALEGRTVTGVELTYSQPGAPGDTRVSGYIDDIELSVPVARDTSDGLVSYVDTRRGTNSSGGYSRGNNIPATAVPNGFNFVVPFTNADTRGTIYAYQRDNNAQNLPELQGIGFSHQPSIWMNDRNQVITMPAVGGDPDGSLKTRAMAFRHENEVARPDFYRVRFDNGVLAETAPTDHGAVFRYTFTGDANSVIIDGGYGPSKLTVAADGRVTGWVNGGSGWPGRTIMFVAGKFTQTPTAAGTAKGSRSSARYATFNTAESKTVELKLATSFISQDQAWKNFNLELAARGYDDVKAAATQMWNERLSVVTDIKGAADHELVNFYSGLYRLNLYPNSQFENIGSAQAPAYQYASPVQPTQGRPSDTYTNAKVVNGKIYVNNGFWDTYRTAWPLYALLHPQETEELVNGFVQQYRDGGWISRWSAPGYADLMTGTSSDVAFAEAYMAGALSTPLALEAYDAAVKNATVRPETRAVGRKGLERSMYLGFTEDTTHESASWGLEGYINDFGIANMARKLAEDPLTPRGRVERLREEADYFEMRANQFIHHYNPNEGVFTSRKADGTWPEKFDKKEWGGAFTEASGWTFAFHAPHNVDGLAALFGGRKGLLKEFDDFFTERELADRSGIHEAREARDVRMGMLGLSNQIAHHIPYVFVEAGRPALAQKAIRELMQRLFAGSDIGQGYPGDEDNGEFGAWYVFSALGFYPLQVGSGDYTIGSPLFESATLNIEGRKLVINAPGTSEGKIYVAGVKHNGKELTSTAIDGDLIRSGGTLEFTMSAEPSDWGNKDLDEKLTVPAGHTDVTGPTFGTVRATGGTDVSELTDDVMVTTVTFPQGEVELIWESAGAPVEVYSYTITSAEEPHPVSWTLEGSVDGQSWTELDRRETSFDHDFQVRPFNIATPGAHAQYRLTVRGQDGQPLELAEIELLGRAVEGTPLRVRPADAVQARAGTPLSAVLAVTEGGKPVSATVDFGDGQGPVAAELEAAGAGSYRVRAPHTLTKPGVYRAVVVVTDESGSTAQAVTMVHISDDQALVSQFNNVCIGDLGETAANCDMQGHGYDRAKLAATGFRQGETLTVPGTDLTYDLPAIPAGEPDNITGEGQTLRLNLGEGATRISFIGMGTEMNRETTGVLTYADGSTQEVPIHFGDWVGASNNPRFNNVVVGVSDGRLSGKQAEKTVKKTSVYATEPFALATDANGRPRTVRSLTLPAEEGTLRYEGRIHIFAIASDGQRSATDAVTVTAKEVPPVWTGVQTGGDLAMVTSGYGLDDATATVNWGDGTDLADATVEDGTVRAQHVYDKPGTYTVWVSVFDGVSSAETSLTITVTNPVPTALEITSPPTQTVLDQGEALDPTGLTAEVTLEDGTTRTLSATEMELSGFDPLVLGEQTVTASFTEGDKTVQATFTVRVRPKDPELTGLADSTATVGEAVTLTPAVDHGTAPLTFTVSGQPAGLSIDPATGVLSGTPTTAGAFEVVVTVKDADGRTAQRAFTITVREAGPQIGEIGDVRAAAGEPVTVTPAAEGGTQPVTWSMTGAPAGLEINPATGEVSGSVHVQGDHTVVLTATDADGRSHQRSFTLKVGAPAPKLTPVSDLSATVGDYLLVVPTTVGGTQPLTYSVSGAPQGLTVNPVRGVLAGRAAEAGEFQITLTVTDADGRSAQQTFKVTVAAAPAPTPAPTVTVTAPPSPAPTVTVTSKPQPQPTVTVTVKPTARPTPTRKPFPRSRPYTQPGTYQHNGRLWRTRCEAYSQTERCTTEIWATKVVRTPSGAYTQRQQWVFNNLTYLPFMTRAQWGNNPLARPGTFTSNGRQWRTECDTAVTGRNACRSYILSTVTYAQRGPRGWVYGQRQEWVFNNLVMFGNYTR